MFFRTMPLCRTLAQCRQSCFLQKHVFAIQSLLRAGNVVFSATCFRRPFFTTSCFRRPPDCGLRRFFQNHVLKNHTFLQNRALSRGLHHFNDSNFCKHCSVAQGAFQKCLFWDQALASHHVSGMAVPAFRMVASFLLKVVVNDLGSACQGLVLSSYCNRPNSAIMLSRRQCIILFRALLSRAIL